MREIKAKRNYMIYLEMTKDTFRDKLMDLGEGDFVDWVENKAFNREEQ